MRGCTHTSAALEAASLMEALGWNLRRPSASSTRLILPSPSWQPKHKVSACSSPEWPQGWRSHSSATNSANACRVCMGLFAALICAQPRSWATGSADVLCAPQQAAGTSWAASPPARYSVRRAKGQRGNEMEGVTSVASLTGLGFTYWHAWVRL